MVRLLPLSSRLLSALPAVNLHAGAILTLNAPRPIVLAQSPSTQQTLRAVIDDLHTGSPDMNPFEPMLRVAVQQRLAEWATRR